ncbi:hypothetical protein ABGV42_17725 [Paenibacillus pabuli]|uniref:hypothetical protein n=1 Tax=Paenibacillus pabuli TaxID=1472 RepID=UPI003242B27E
MNQANNKNNELTRKLLLNSNSRGVKDEVVPMGQGAVDDTEFAVELGEGPDKTGSFWESSDFAREHRWEGQVETHEMFRRSYE